MRKSVKNTDNGKSVSDQLSDELLKKLRHAGFLACRIGLPLPVVSGDVNGLRVGTPELVRWGMGVKDMNRLAELIAKALSSNAPESLAAEVSAWQRSFNTLHYISG